MVRAALTRDDDYATVGKPPCDRDDKAARDALVDAPVRDADAALAVLEGRGSTGALGEAAQVLALVAGQEVEPGADGMLRIARRVARDRVISTVDTRARHGRKSRARKFDWYRAYLAVDPDDELITNVAVTPASAADRDVIDDLLDDPVPVSDRDSDSAAAATTAIAAMTVTRVMAAMTVMAVGVPRPLQGPVRHRRARRHGNLPGAAHHADPCAARRRWVGPRRTVMRRLPAACRVHHATVGSGDHDPSARSPTAAGQGRAA